MLQTAWGPPLSCSAPGTSPAAFTWKGKGAAIEELLEVYTGFEADPGPLLRRLLTDALKKVPTTVSAGAAGVWSWWKPQAAGRNTGIFLITLPAQ